MPKIGEFVAFGEFCSSVEDGNGSCEDFEFTELNTSIDGGILSVGLLEEGGCFFDAGAFLDQSAFTIDLLHLFWLEVVLGFKLGDLGKFFVDVAHLLLESLQEGLVLLFYNLRAIFGILLVLWLWFF